ncbi:MAG: hypothetical protein AABZ47_11095 [Planctomycetota bacterium]
MMGLNLRIPVGFLCIFCAGFASFALAQDDPAKSAQNKLLAKRAAEADCYRKLAESVYGVKITSDTTVRDFVTESDEIRASVDTFIKGVKLGPPRYYEDGACEVPGEVTVAKLVTKLKELHATHYKGNTVKTTDIEQIQQIIQTDIIKAVGNGAPRPELPPDLPAGIEAVIEPLPQGYSPPPMSVPAIWRSVGPQARLMAERGATLDAVRKLLEQIKGLRLTSDTLVRDFITESDEISAHAAGIVVGAQEVGKYLHTDELIVDVTVEIPLEKVITRIKELHSEHYHGNKVTTTDITNVKKSIVRETVQATGSGVPAKRFIQQATSAGFQMPEWVADRVEVVGQGTDPAIDTAQGKLKAARAAEMDGMRKLAEQINGLRISSNTTVQDFVTQNDEIRSQVDALLAGAVSDPATFAEGIAKVRISIPAGNVWTVVNQHQIIIARRK